MPIPSTPKIHRIVIDLSGFNVTPRKIPVRISGLRPLAQNNRFAYYRRILPENQGFILETL
jgi:hypothetical protein